MSTPHIHHEYGIHHNDGTRHHHHGAGDHDILIHDHDAPLDHDHWLSGIEHNASGQQYLYSTADHNHDKPSTLSVVNVSPDDYDNPTGYLHDDANWQDGIDNLTGGNPYGH